MLKTRDSRFVVFIAASGVLLQYFVVWLAAVFGERDWARLLRRGDGTWYLWIADHGYSVGQLLGDTSFYSPKSDYVFYPVLPVLAKSVSNFGISTEHAALAINAFSTVLTAALLYEFLRKNFSKFVAIAVPAMWVFQPFAIVLVTVLTESLFSLFTIGVLLSIQRRREFVASLCMVAVCLTRTTGAAIALTVLIYYLVKMYSKAKSIRSLSVSEWTLLAASILGPFIWPVYVGKQIGRADGYFYLQGEQWHSKFDAGISFISKTIESVNIFDSEPTSTRFQIIAIANIIAMILLIMLIRSRPPLMIWLSTLGIVSMAASQASWFSVKQRFLVPAYFLFIPVALWLETKRNAVKFGTAITFLIMTVSMTWWISMYYPKWL